MRPYGIKHKRVCAVIPTRHYLGCDRGHGDINEAGAALSGHCLGQHRLACARRAEEKDALAGLEEGGREAGIVTSGYAKRGIMTNKAGQEDGLAGLKELGRHTLIQDVYSRSLKNEEGD